MFDLEKEVTAWSEAVHADRCRNAASVAELRDHLHCEIDRARGRGLSDEQAFAEAVARLGDRSELAAEEAKNRSVLGTACAVARYDRSLWSNERGGLLVAHSVVWASLMVATAIVLSKADVSRAVGCLLIALFVPIWWASQQILWRALRHKPTGGAE